MTRQSCTVSRDDKHSGKKGGYLLQYNEQTIQLFQYSTILKQSMGIAESSVVGLYHTG